jgi:hypothetical protein
MCVHVCVRACVRASGGAVNTTEDDARQALSGTSFARWGIRATNLAGPTLTLTIKSILKGDCTPGPAEHGQ